jgi:hypothetical protein
MSARTQLHKGDADPARALFCLPFLLLLLAMAFISLAEAFGLDVARRAVPPSQHQASEEPLPARGDPHAR